MTNTAIDLEQIAFEDHFIQSDTPGVKLYVRNKRLRSITHFAPERTIIMVHGATFSSGSLYDVRMGGFSFMEYMASAGFDVFAVDVRGYGHSTRPPEMEQDASLATPVVDTDIAVIDFGTAVDFVLHHRKIDRINIFGMSWGGTVAGAYTAANTEKVVKLSVLAPQWLSQKPIPIDTGGELHSYRLVPVRASKARWLSTAPDHARHRLVPDGWFEAWADATLAEDPWSAEKAPDLLRASNGPIQDIRDYWKAGRPYYDPAKIIAPVLLVHGEWDVDVTIDLALDYFSKLTSARYKRWVEIGEATHLALMESNRLQAFDAISGFFLEEFKAE